MSSKHGIPLDRVGPFLAPLLASALAALAACGGSPAGDSSAHSDPGSALFLAPNAWTERVDSAPLAPSSGAVLGWLAQQGGWGTGEMRIDFSMEVLEADAATPFLSFVPNGSFYSPDCDQVPFPVPAGGALEGETGYACAHGGDCHLLVVDRAARRLYEMYAADLSGGTFRGGCAVVWDLARTYPPDLRGDQCTSSDAAGLPVAALLFSADEVAAGSIDHAIRFVLPNDRIRSGVFVRPATHAGAPAGPAAAPPYGARLRLRADYPLASLPNEAARVIARAMQRYGIVLADGGNIALTARSDRSTRARWAALGVDSRSLAQLAVSDFEMVEAGPTISLTYDCVRNGL
jgi:serine/threonine-protein kinase